MRKHLLALALIVGSLASPVGFHVAPGWAQAPPPVPAEPDTERRTRYTGVSSVTTFPVGFDIYGDGTDFSAWIEVWVNGINIPFSSNWSLVPSAGSFTTLSRPLLAANLNVVFSVPQSGTIDIVGARRPRRTSQLSNNAGVTARDFNQVVTDLWMTLRETWDRTNDITGRAILGVPGDNFGPLPPALARAGQYLCFASPAGQPTMCAGAQGSGTIAAGNGITFTGTNPTTISAKIGNGLALSGSSVVTAPGVDINNPNNGTQTGTYAVQSTDCGGIIPLSGNAFYTATLGAASGFPTNCEVTIANIDQWGSGRGKVVSVSGLTLPISILYPQQAWKFRRIANAWFQENNYQLSQAPLGTRLYVDVVNGSNNNDCLAAGSGNACHDLNWVVMHVIWQSIVASGGSGTGSNADFDIRLANDPSCIPATGVNCHPGLHFSGLPKQVEGHNAIMIECDSGSATNCTIADSSGNAAIGVFVAANLELRNVTLAGGSAGNNAISVEMGMVRIQDGVVLGNTGTSPQLQVIDHGSLFVEGGVTLTISGTGAGYLVQTTRGGVAAFDQAVIQWVSNFAYSASTLNANTFSAISAVGTTWQKNGFTITAPNNIGCGPGGVVSTSGTIATVPGTNTQTGCAASGQGQAS